MSQELPAESKEAIHAVAQRIKEQVQLVGAIGEVLAMFEGSGKGPQIELDCFGVIGALIASRTADVFEAVSEIEALLEGPASGV